jgi:hypothetical protein
VNYVIGKPSVLFLLRNVNDVIGKPSVLFLLRNSQLIYNEVPIIK